MHLNRKNYETWFLDYYENKLVPQQVAELMVFLEGNPDLKSEFESFENISLDQTSSIAFPDKKKLVKPEYKPIGGIDNWNYETQMVAFLEGDLANDERENLLEFTRINPKTKLEMNLFRKTFLQAPQMVFPEKDLLKKTGLFVLYRTRLIYSITTAAAIIILLFGLFSVLNIKTNRSYQSIENMPMVQSKSIEGHETGSSVIAAPIFRNSAEDRVFASSPPPERYFRQNNQAIQTMQYIFSRSIQVEFYMPADQGLIATSTRYNGDLTNMLTIPEEKEKSFTARFLAGFFNKIIGDPMPENKTLIEYSVDGYNLIADREVEVNRKLDQHGNIVAYNINGQTISVARNRNSQP
ncbi:MAG: hypothetical protein KDC05_15620 [Bacteroidales bacterium]|nr:hypothetical protein [Bacteroidales bacterium]